MYGLQDYEQSLKRLYKAVELSSGNFEAYNLMGKILMKKNDNQATYYFTKAIKLDPLNFQFYLDKLNCLKHFFGLCNEAFDLINLMAEKFSTSAEALYQKGKFKVKKISPLSIIITNFL